MATSTSLSSIIEHHRPSFTSYESLYKDLHAHPELSFLEEKTAATIKFRLIALRKQSSFADADFKINTGIGGHGIAVTIANGSGPTVLLRADIDGLPVEEKTGLPYASKDRMVDPEGIEWPTMHACGHDMHITSLLAATELLLSARENWSGTLLLIFQPAEEKGAGAQAMVDDGLYSKNLAPIPDIVLGAHVMPYRAGTIGTKPKLMAAAADSMKVKLYGRGGHASQPHRTCDPITMAAYTVTRLQTLVSREINPLDPAVVTVASIHAGSAENIISETAELKLNVRSFSKEVRDHLLSGIHRIVDAESNAHGAPSPPTYSTISTFPLTINDETLTAKLNETMTAHFGDDYDPQLGPLQGSEDFSILGTSVDKPCCFWVYGGTDPELWDKKEKEGVDIPINHSPYFAPVIQPTLQVAVDGYAVGALTWLLKK